MKVNIMTVIYITAVGTGRKVAGPFETVEEAERCLIAKGWEKKE